MPVGDLYRRCVFSRGVIGQKVARKCVNAFYIEIRQITLNASKFSVGSRLYLNAAACIQFRL